MVLACSDPNACSVAPFGGLDPVFTPNPVSAGIPAPGLPIVMDISTSATTNGLTNRLASRKARRLAGAGWVLEGQGRATDGPGEALFREPNGTILPLGGLDSGQQGRWARRCWWEVLTGGLAGHGRADAKEGWGATVFLQIIDPDAFAGLAAFQRQTGELVRQCHASRPAQPGKPVRAAVEKMAVSSWRRRSAA